MRIALFPLGQLQPLVQLLLKLAIAHPVEDVGTPGFVLTTVKTDGQILPTSAPA